jgi:hypothetical protein
MLPGRKNVVMSFWGGQGEGLWVKITIMVCFLWISLNVMTLYLLSVIVVDFKGYGRPFITKEHDWHTKTSSVCMIMSGPKLPARLVTSYGTMAGRIWTIHATVWSCIQLFPSLWTPCIVCMHWHTSVQFRIQSLATASTFSSFHGYLKELLKQHIKDLT